MIRSRFWLKTTLLVLFFITLSALSIAFYTIPLTRNITYQMAESQATALLDHVYDLVEGKHQDIESYKAFALKTRKDELKAVTATAGYIIKNEYAASMAGSISPADAKHSAIEQMRKIRYGHKDYLWISDFNSVLISHPDPKLQDADFSHVKDVYGNLIVPPMVAVARKNGEGFTSYWWNRLGMESASEKLTYSTLFAPWSWVYGTGVYLDDITQEVDRRKKKLVEDLRTLIKKKVIGKSGYMYIFDGKMNMIIHPNKRLENKNLENLLDPRTGKPILKELMKTAHTKGALLEYPWNRPTDPQHFKYEKISWVRHHKGFNWYIASSIYVNELYTQSHFLTVRIAWITAAVILMSLIICSYCLKKFLSPIEHLSKTALKVQHGDLKVKSGIVRHDEIGILAREFDAMVSTLNSHVEALDEKVKEKTHELAENYHQLEYTNGQLMESIGYARIIQQAMLPQSQSRPVQITDSFVLWRPKDIIGGDIFWLLRNKKGFLLAVIDCTGHGVPGAIVTMIATMAMNQVVQELGPESPGAILKRLNSVIQSTLRQDATDAPSDDGLDIALCSMNDETDILTFAGANLSLFVQEQDKVERIKGDRKSIGYKSADLAFDFTEHEIPIHNGKRFYMTTDGLIGQAGGDHCLPFGYRRFLKFISEHHTYNFSNQKKALETLLGQYQGNETQRDDITVIGFTCEKGGTHA